MGQWGEGYFDIRNGIVTVGIDDVAEKSVPNARWGRVQPPMFCGTLRMAIGMIAKGFPLDSTSGFPYSAALF